MGDGVEKGELNAVFAKNDASAIAAIENMATQAGERWLGNSWHAASRGQGKHTAS
jgi:hypothetical protein